VEQRRITVLNKVVDKTSENGAIFVEHTFSQASRGNSKYW